jgi:hypothetical protein
MWADRWLGPMERRALALAFACSACFALDLSGDGPPTEERTAARYIDSFCEQGNYELEGSAERTTGLTSDSCGFSVGPSEGIVRFIVPSSDLAGYTSSTFEALVAREDGSDPNWIFTAGVGRSSGTATFEVYPEAGYKKRRIIDVRLLGALPDPTPGCSIADRIARQRYSQTVATREIESTKK